MTDDVFDWNYVREPIINAAIELRKQDPDLFRLHAHERAITHRFASLIESKLYERGNGNTWKIDCEYNRLGPHSEAYKRFPTFASFRSEFLKDELEDVVSHEKIVAIFDRLWSSGKLSPAYPDIIIHRRTKMDRKNNLCIIEVKMDWNATGREEIDLEKLRFFTAGGYDDFEGYWWGLFLKFAESGVISSAERYHLKKEGKFEVMSLINTTLEPMREQESVSIEGSSG